ncbi:MAG: HEPN domain-containing protein [Anaerolineae bacterium]|nr:HEPN domain-containing protein [Anaerolineae bacterium]
MRPDAVVQGRRWLEQAEADRRGAQLLFDGASYHLACFIAQQVAEKALKAFILPDNIPAQVYTRNAAEETLRIADQALALVRKKFPRG